MFEIYEATLEVYVSDKLAQRQTMQAPKEMLMMNYVQMVNQISRDKRPMKVKMIVPEVIWDNFENKQKILNNSVECDNYQLVGWQSSKQGAD